MFIVCIAVDEKKAESGGLKLKSDGETEAAILTRHGHGSIDEKVENRLGDPAR